MIFFHKRDLEDNEKGFPTTEDVFPLQKTLKALVFSSVSRIPYKGVLFVKKYLLSLENL